jgi:hypothetical protein
MIDVAQDQYLALLFAIKIPSMLFSNFGLAGWLMWV